MSLTGLAILLAYLGGLGLALFRHPRYGVYTYLAVYYLDPPSRWWSAFLPDMRWSLVAGVVALLATLRAPVPPNTPSWSTTTPARLLIVFTVWLWIQNLWALAPDEHLAASILFTKYVILFAMLYRLLSSLEELSGVLLVHVLGCFYLGWLAHVAPPGGRLEGVGGPGIDEANALAMFMATGVVCASMIVLVEKGWKRWTAIVAMPFLLNTIVQSESRGAMLALVVAGLVLFYLKPKPFSKGFYFYAILGIVGFGMIAQSSSFWDRMRSLEATVDQNEEIDSSAESRVVLFHAQVQMFLDHPFGVGHRGTAVLSPRYLDAKWLTKDPNNPTAPPARSSHNSFMSALVEQGVPGAVIFIWLAAWVVKSIFTLKRFRDIAADPRGPIVIYGPAVVGAAMVVLVAGNFTDYLKTEVQIWMWTLLAAITAIHIPKAETAAGATRVARSMRSPLPLDKRKPRPGVP